VSVGECGRGLLDLDLDRPRAGSYLTEAGVIRGRGEVERPRGDERGLAPEFASLGARGLERAESCPSHVLPSAAAAAAAASNFCVRNSL